MMGLQGTWNISLSCFVYWGSSQALRPKKTLWENIFETGLLIMAVCSPNSSCVSWAHTLIYMTYVSCVKFCAVDFRVFWLGLMLFMFPLDYTIFCVLTVSDLVASKSLTDVCWNGWCFLFLKIRRAGSNTGIGNYPVIHLIFFLPLQ